MWENAKIMSLLFIAKCPKKNGIKKSKIAEIFAIDLLNKILLILYKPYIVAKPNKEFIIWNTSKLKFFGNIWDIKLERDQYKVENLYL